jgi:hypothetical protein
MNERIRELAEQCVGDRPYNNSFDYEKFAELIIRECAKLADELTSRPYESYGEKIKKHFGVE